MTRLPPARLAFQLRRRLVGALSIDQLTKFTDSNSAAGTCLHVGLCEREDGAASRPCLSPTLTHSTVLQRQHRSQSGLIDCALWYVLVLVVTALVVVTVLEVVMVPVVMVVVVG